MTDWVVVVLYAWDHGFNDVTKVIGPLSEEDARARANAHNVAIAQGWEDYRGQWEAWHRRRVELFGLKHPLADEERAQLGTAPGTEGPEETEAVAVPLTP